MTITTDSIAASAQINERLAQLGVTSQAYAFSGAPQEALRYAIDPAWMREKPRAYRYSPNGEREVASGVIETERFAQSR